MNIFESIASAISSVFSNKMRTFLTMLGIIIGISSVIMITSIGQGVRKMMNDQFSSIGSNLIAVYVKGWNFMKDKDKLDFEDVDLMARHPNVENVAPYLYSGGKVSLRNPDKQQVAMIIGTNENYNILYNMELLYGRFLNERDYATESKAVVIDEWGANQIFGRKNVLGEKIKVEFTTTTEELSIVGVTKSEIGAEYGAYSRIELYMPLNTLNSILGEDEDHMDNIYAAVKDTSQLEKTSMEILKLLEVKHENEDMYGFESYMEQVKMINNSLNMVTNFISFVAAISLIVGGVGVMNIMLVTVTERTREIGIRKSLGATNSNIRIQFLIEAMILSFIGGVIGIILGYLGGLGISSIITNMTGTTVSPVVSMPVVIGTVVISSMIGILFGVYPAGKAAKLDPIEALRYE